MSTQNSHVCAPSLNSPPNDPYATLSHFFLELRGRGLSLSSMDIETLFLWKQMKIPVEIIMEIAWGIADECLAQKKPFPATLAPIHRRVNRYLKKRSEF